MYGIDLEKLKAFNSKYATDEYFVGWLWPMIMFGDPSQNSKDSKEILTKLFAVTKGLELVISNEGGPMAEKLLRLNLDKLAEIRNVTLYAPTNELYDTTGEAVAVCLDHADYLQTMSDIFEELPARGDSRVIGAHKTFMEMNIDYFAFKEQINKLISSYKP
jgi:hypothetical protein